MILPAPATRQTSARSTSTRAPRSRLAGVRELPLTEPFPSSARRSAHGGCARCRTTAVMTEQSVSFGGLLQYVHCRLLTTLVGTYPAPAAAGAGWRGPGVCGTFQHASVLLKLCPSELPGISHHLTDQRSYIEHCRKSHHRRSGLNGRDWRIYSARDQAVNFSMHRVRCMSRRHESICP